MTPRKDISRTSCGSATRQQIAILYPGRSKAPPQRSIGSKPAGLHSSRTHRSPVLDTNPTANGISGKALIRDVQ